MLGWQTLNHSKGLKDFTDERDLDTISNMLMFTLPIMLIDTCKIGKKPSDKAALSVQKFVPIPSVQQQLKKPIKR